VTILKPNICHYYKGGDGNLSLVTTLPNILRMYNPNLGGFSTGGQECNMSHTCGLNMAQHSAMGSSMLDQAQELVRTVRQMGMEHFRNDWKLITTYVGTNDICSLSCLHGDEVGADYWVNNITIALDYLKDNLPRTLVNLVQLMNIGEMMKDAMSHSTMGDDCTSSFMSMCTCVDMNENDTELENFIQVTDFYQRMLEFAISRGQYDGMDNFTVVLQPFMKAVQLNHVADDVDLSPFASDCFHLSPAGHRSLAMALWNNMFQRVENKSSNFQMSSDTMLCPTEDEPFIYTVQNSLQPEPTSESQNE